ncbi:MAG: molecular chaperone TorD family protein [Brockia lithotrophica]|nr:molecular chaperone TorD family protein [Brockia lithotrophica]
MAFGSTCRLAVCRRTGVRMDDRSRSAKAELYRFFAEFFKPPEEGFFREFTSPRFPEELARWFAEAGYAVTASAPNLRELWPSFEEFAEDYRRAISGTIHPYAPPVESIYKPWTEDPGAEVPMAGQKGYFYGDPAVHMRHLYDELGIALSPEYASMPDHLTLELEFLAFLFEAGEAEAARLFIREHLDWLGEFRAELETTPRGERYARIVAWLEELLRQEPEPENPPAGEKKGG